MFSAYYNEIDPYAAQWLRNLIAAGHIAPGEVDERSIEDVTPDDLRGFTQCHFFAGISGWSIALRSAGWDDSRHVWTASLPCQPFSAAGKRQGTKDERHLWPVFYRLVRACRPDIIFGEQVSSSDAVGKVGRPSTRVLELWSQQASIRVLKNRLEESLSISLQDMSECVCEGMAPEQEDGRNTTGEPSSDRRQKSVAREGSPIQFESALGVGEANSGCVRGDRDSIRHGHEERMGHAVVGQGGSESRLHGKQYAAGDICAERSVRGLGRGNSNPSRIYSLRGAQEKIAESLRINIEEIEREGGLSWIDSVVLDLEDAHYTCGVSVFPAAGVGAPQIRHRTYWVAVSASRRPEMALLERSDGGQEDSVWEASWSGVRCPFSRLGDSYTARLEGRDAGSMGHERATAERGSSPSRLAGADEGQRGRIAGGEGRECNGQAGGWQQGDGRASGDCEAGGMGGSDGGDACTEGLQRSGEHGQRAQDGGAVWGGDCGARSGPAGGLERPGPVGGFWRASDWLYCRDDKWRPVEPGTFPLASGAPARMGRLRAYGNAICVPQAVAFVEAVTEALLSKQLVESA